MKTNLLTMLGIALLLGTASFCSRAGAADMPVKAPPAAPPPLSGWYVLASFDGAVARPGGAAGTFTPAGIGGAFGGGYDFTQTGNSVVFGLMASGGYENIRGTSTCALLSCTSANTWKGDVAARIGFSFATLNGFLAGRPNFTAANNKLPVPLAPIAALDAAVLYFKIGAAVEHLAASVDSLNQSRNDIAIELGAGLDLPVTQQFFIRPEVNWLRFNQSLCGGCALPFARPTEYTAKIAMGLKF